jgi:hypothetical protein
MPERTHVPADEDMPLEFRHELMLQEVFRGARRKADIRDAG